MTNWCEITPIKWSYNNPTSNWFWGVQFLPPPSPFPLNPLRLATQGLVPSAGDHGLSIGWDGQVQDAIGVARQGCYLCHRPQGLGGSSAPRRVHVVSGLGNQGDRPLSGVRFFPGGRFMAYKLGWSDHYLRYKRSPSSRSFNVETPTGAW